MHLRWRQKLFFAQSLSRWYRYYADPTSSVPQGRCCPGVGTPGADQIPPSKTRKQHSSTSSVGGDNDASVNPY